MKMENEQKEKCITEKAFIECSCKRCKSYRDNMLSQAMQRTLFEIIRTGLDNMFKKEEVANENNNRPKK